MIDFDAIRETENKKIGKSGKIQNSYSRDECVTTK